MAVFGRGGGAGGDWRAVLEGGGERRGGIEGGGYLTPLSLELESTVQRTSSPSNNRACLNLWSFFSILNRLPSEIVMLIGSGCPQ